MIQALSDGRQAVGRNADGRQTIGRQTVGRQADGQSATERVVALDGYVNRFGDLLYRIAWVLLGNREDAEDAVQDSCLAWLERGPDFESEEHARAWFVHVLRNRCRNVLRSRSRHRTGELDAERLAAPATPVEIQDPEARRLFAALLELPLDDRELLTLIALDHSPTECAHLLGLSPATLRKRLERARKRLRRELERGRSTRGTRYE
ncbi:MAG: sigma-70 family RNA polymerase sigma factor [Bacillota bacterium]|nr:sigma-70 family RNA polymerase sigma factor [Bacillota bacterium]